MNLPLKSQDARTKVARLSHLSGKPLGLKWQIKEEGSKSSFICLKQPKHLSFSVICHISVLFIPEIWSDKQHIVILQCNFANNN